MISSPLSSPGLDAFMHDMYSCALLLESCGETQRRVAGDDSAEVLAVRWPERLEGEAGGGIDAGPG